jgi:hypothetical protein
VALILETGDENAGQVISIPVPGRSSPLVVRPVTATPPVTVATTQAAWGAGTGITAGALFLRPWNPSLGVVATAGNAWITTDRARSITHIRVSITTAHGADIDFTLSVGASVATLAAATAFVLPAGLLTADFSFAAGLLPVPAGGFMALSALSAVNVTGNACEVLVELTP